MENRISHPSRNPISRPLRLRFMTAAQRTSVPTAAFEGVTGRWSRPCGPTRDYPPGARSRWASWLWLALLEQGTPCRRADTEVAEARAGLPCVTRSPPSCSHTLRRTCPPPGPPGEEQPYATGADSPHARTHPGLRWVSEPAPPSGELVTADIPPKKRQLFDEGTST
jgi:hypothetical protein